MRLLFFIISTISFLCTQAEEGLGNVYFVSNHGQWNDLVQLKADIPGGALFLEEGAITYHFIDQSNLEHNHHSHFNALKGHAFQWRFVKSQTPKIHTKYQLQGTVNYFKKGVNASGLSRFQEVQYEGVYPNIDYRIYAYSDGLKYDWVVAPKGNPDKIQLELEGAENVRLINGRLHIQTSVNEMIEETPYAYQIINGEKIEVRCEFVWKKNKLSFHFPDGYDQSKELVIDPILIFSTYSGSTAMNFGFTATYDDYGFLYAGGTAFALGYPTTLGAYDNSFNGSVDIVLSKYDTTGTFMVYSTYLGGYGDEVPHSLIVHDNELYMMGTTGSSNYPTTTGCFDDSFDGGVPVAISGVSVDYDNGCDMVVSRLSSDGTQLLSSTFLGGSGNDGLNLATQLRYNYADQMRGEIDFDSEGNCYIASSTQSDDFPIVGGSIQASNNGQQEGVVVKMDTDLSAIQWSTYWGGTSNDAIYSLAFNANDDIYVSGGTRSSTLVTTTNAYEPTYLGGTVDAFISQFSADGSSLLNSTFFGSSEYDQAYFIELDNTDSVYIFGQSTASGSTLINNAGFSQPNSGQFVAKLSADLSVLQFSTVFGSGNGGVDISPTAFLVDVCNRVYCSGWGGATNSNENYGGPGGNTADLITTTGAYQTTTDSSDFYLIIIEDNANTLSYATFFGGDDAAEHVDGGTSRFDKKGVVYQSVCAGCGYFSDFPTTDNAVSETNNALCNNAVFKFDPEFPLTIANFSAPDLSCDFSIQFDNLSLGDNNTYVWDFGDGTTSTEENPTHIYNSVGVYEITLISNDPTSCNLTDEITQSIQIRENQFDLLDSLELCLGDSVQFDFPTSTGFSYSWNPTSYLSSTSIPNPVATPQDTITYYYVGTQANCVDTVEQYIAVTDLVLNYELELEMCGLPILLTAETDSSAQLIWSTQPNFNNPQPDSIYATHPGVYYLMATKYDCQKKAVITVGFDAECCSEDKIVIPNAFTPNGDLMNDHYKIKDELNIVKNIELHIFNRWGQKVFYSADKNEGWDGSFKGNKLQSDVFDYYMQISCIGGEATFFKKGDITLIR